MILDFDKIEEKVIPEFKGGEKNFIPHMFTDDKVKIMRARLEPGASIGYHIHDTKSEIIFLIKGTGVVIYDDEREILEAGQCHYCPMGHSHSLRNESHEDIEFYAVVPEHV